MSSYRIGSVEIDRERLAADFVLAERGGFVDAYTEFICGTWRSCMLWNASGDSEDFRIREYSGQAQITEYGRQLVYVDEIMSSNFDLERLRFARLTRLTPGSVVIPHRDYIELESELVRIHVPLETDPEAYASEEQVIYRMGRGEIWFLDATRVHSIANFSQVNRTHLLLDFLAANPCDVVRVPVNQPPSLPAESIAGRRVLSDGEREAFLALSRIIDQASLMDVVAMLIKRYFVADMDVSDVFEWLEAIAVGSNDAKVATQAKWLRQHALHDR